MWFSRPATHEPARLTNVDRHKTRPLPLQDALLLLVEPFYGGENAAVCIHGQGEGAEPDQETIRR